eukprot:6417385-Alexandrium_andersonii.AAC.1
MVDKGGRACNALRRGARREERAVHRDTHQATVACQTWRVAGLLRPGPRRVCNRGEAGLTHTCAS